MSNTFISTKTKERFSSRHFSIRSEGKIFCKAWFNSGRAEFETTVCKLLSYHFKTSKQRSQLTSAPLLTMSS